MTAVWLEFNHELITPLGALQKLLFCPVVAKKKQTYRKWIIQLWEDCSYNFNEQRANRTELTFIYFEWQYKNTFIVNLYNEFYTAPCFVHALLISLYFIASNFIAAFYFISHFTGLLPRLFFALPPIICSFFIFPIDGRYIDSGKFGNVRRKRSRHRPCILGSAKKEHEKRTTHPSPDYSVLFLQRGVTNHDLTCGFSARGVHSSQRCVRVECTPAVLSVESARILLKKYRKRGIGEGRCRIMTFSVRFVPLSAQTAHTRASCLEGAEEGKGIREIGRERRRREREGVECFEFYVLRPLIP